MRYQRPTVVPPVVDAADWEEYPTFRETFLLRFTDPEINAAFRAVGGALFSIMLDGGVLFTSPPGLFARHELAAAAADLRHLQGFFLNVAEEGENADPDLPRDAELIRLTRLAARLAKQVGKLADKIAEALAARPAGR
jgi:hypothetical protein